MKFRIKNNLDLIEYDNLNSYINYFIEVFLNKGVKPDTHVSILSENSIEYILSIIALIKIGTIVVPLNTKFSQSQILQALFDFEIDYLITNSEIRYKGIIPFPSLEFSRKGKDILAEFKNPSEKLQNQISNIILSSGSSGKPKGVVHKYSNHFYNAESSNSFHDFNENDSWLLTLPLYHIGGFSIIWKCILAEAQLEIPSNQNDINSTNSTHYSFVLTQFKRIIEDENQLNSLNVAKMILLGGSSIPESLIQNAIAHNLPIRTSYGMSEMSSQIATSKNLSSSVIEYDLLKFSDVKIDKGEVLVKGKCLFLGYFINGEIHLKLDNKGYFKTGDLGEILNEKIKILGRKDNMFISGGENIYPEKIEKEVVKLTGSDHCYIIPCDDPEYGHSAICVLNKTINIKDLNELLKNTLSKFEIPKKYYRFPDDDSYFKINRRELKQLLDRNELKII